MTRERTPWWWGCKKQCNGSGAIGGGQNDRGTVTIWQLVRKGKGIEVHRERQNWHRTHAKIGPSPLCTSSNTSKLLLRSCAQHLSINTPAGPPQKAVLQRCMLHRMGCTNPLYSGQLLLIQDPGGGKFTEWSIHCLRWRLYILEGIRKLLNFGGWRHMRLNEVYQAQHFLGGWRTIWIDMPGPRPQGPK